MGTCREKLLNMIEKKGLGLIDSMKGNKSPGHDDIPTYVHTTYLHMLVPLLRRRRQY